MQIAWAVDGKARTGNPSDYKLKDGETLAIDFLPKGADQPFPPDACTAFSQINDNSTANLSKNSRASRSTPRRRRCPRTRPPRSPPRRRRDPGAHDDGGRREGDRPRRWRGHAPPAADLHHAQAAAPDRQPGLPRASARVARRARRRRGRAVARVPARRVRGRTSPTVASATWCSGTRSKPEPLGTAGGIRFAAAGLDERLVVCNGDVLTDLDLDQLVAFHDERGAEATICLTQVDDPSAFGVVPDRATTARSWRSSRSRRRARRRPTGSTRARTCSSRRCSTDPDAAQRCRSSARRSRACCRNRAACTPCTTDAYWLDIGTPEKYLQAHADVLAGMLGGVPAPGARETAPGVWVQGEPDIHPDARIEAPALIGDGSVVADGARVDGSVVGAGVTVGAGARLLARGGARRRHDQRRRRGDRLRGERPGVPGRGGHRVGPHDRRRRRRAHSRRHARPARASVAPNPSLNLPRRHPRADPCA